MQLRLYKIEKIEQYKSFRSFEWDTFCKNKDGNPQCLGRLAIIFGENGTGKTALCDILKSIASYSEFQNSPPTSVQLELKNEEKNKKISYIYKGDAWRKNENICAENDIPAHRPFLFFDADFINTNVHTHGTRGNKQGEHSQNAGQLIISLDKKANNLQREVEQRTEDLNDFKYKHAPNLSQGPSDSEQEYYNIYKDLKDEDIQKFLIQKKKESEKIKNDLTSLEKTEKEYTKIRSLSPVGTFIDLLDFLPSKGSFIEIFDREIKEKAQDEADESIKAHFEKHKQFIETARAEIPQDYKDEKCPLCMQPLINAKEFIEYYRSVFNNSYEQAKKKLLSDIEKWQDILERRKSDINSLPENALKIFDDLEDKSDIFPNRNDLYIPQDKKYYIEKFRQVSIKEIDEMLKGLNSLPNIKEKTIVIEEKYEIITDTIQKTNKLIKQFNSFIEEKNKIINDYRNKYSNENKIAHELQTKKEEKDKIDKVIDFLSKDKIRLIKEYEKYSAKQKHLENELNDAKNKLKEYLGTIAPQKIISKMHTFLEEFYINFILGHYDNNKNTKDYPFSFTIKDKQGNKREMKAGLSDGERQIISLAFFFAVNDNQKDKQNKILIFDDPITSLDSPNLNILATFIHKWSLEYSQVIVFTHHPLFFKYLSKYKRQTPSKFNILKNSKELGGSFMCYDPGFDVYTELKEYENEKTQSARNGTLSLERITLKYGQLLRLAIEKFIKNDLLMWDQETKFSDIIENLDHSKNKILKLLKSDCDEIKRLYEYCNHSNLMHTDKTSPSTHGELELNIRKFLEIFNRLTSVSPQHKKKTRTRFKATPDTEQRNLI